MERSQLIPAKINDKLEEIVQLLSEIEKEEKWHEVDDLLLQQLIESVIRAYACKKQTDRSEDAPSLMPLSNETRLTDTEVLAMISKLLEAKHLDIFEIQMFRSFCIN